MHSTMTKGEAKKARVLAALNQREADRVPVGEWFWTKFVQRAKQELNAGDDFNPYVHWDLDLVVTIPNMDPHITGVQVLERDAEHVVVKTGYGAVIELRESCPMPNSLKFDTETWEQMEALVFDDPADPRRYHAALDDQINSVTDVISLNLPSFVECVNGSAGDFCVFGSVCEPHEQIWRIIGPENELIKMGEDPARMEKFVERVGDFLLGIVKGQLAAAGGKLSGMYIWGDVGHRQGMMFSPRYWRQVYKPQVTRICDAIHAAGLKAIYHGCGNAAAIYEDLIECGVDCYNPLEAKAGLDVVELKRKYGKRLAFNGNIDAITLSTNDRETIRREVLRKLNAAKGGGYIVQSDSAVTSDVSAATYDYFIQLLREYGNYPLQLGEFDEAV
jgi:hypothetical protein